MLIFLTTLLATLSSILRSRAALELENLALRHQIGVLQRSSAKRPKLNPADRLLWTVYPASGVTGAQRWLSSSQKRSLLGIGPAFDCSGLGRCGAANPDDPSFRTRSELSFARCAARIPGGVPPASMANCSDWASTSLRAVSANTCCASINRAYLPRESCPATGLHRFLHRAHDPFPGSLRVSGVGP